MSVKTGSLWTGSLTLDSKKKYNFVDMEALSILPIILNKLRKFVSF